MTILCHSIGNLGAVSLGRAMLRAHPSAFVRAPERPSLRRSAAVVILLLGFAARLLPFLSLVLHHKAAWIYGRGLETGFVAHALLAGQGFASPFGGNTGPTALISPGYSLLVAGIFRIFGEASDASAIVILLMQIGLGVLTVWLVMQLAARLADGRAALIAGGYFALWPPLLWVPTIFWDTSLTLCLMPALVLLALKLRERPRTRLWLVMGGLCGFAVLVNLALVLTVTAIFVWLVWNVRASRTGLFAAGFFALAIYAPWPIRNAHMFHSFIPLRTTVGLELWMGNREGASGFVDESIFPLYNKAELARYLQLGEVAYMAEKSAAAKAHIVQHPGTFVTLSVKRFLRFWFGAGTQGGPGMYVLGAAFTTVCGLLGLRKLLREGQRGTVLLLAAPALLFPLPYYITHAEFRYRLALDPLLTALSAVLLSGLAQATPRTAAEDFPQGEVSQAENAATEQAVVHA